MGVDSTDHTDRRTEAKSVGGRTEWIERLNWLRHEAESQLPWLDQIDAEVVPPDGRSILGHWLVLSRLQNERYLPLFQAMISNKPRPVVPTEDACLASSRGDIHASDHQLPSRVAEERQQMTSLLESLTPAQWNWLIESDDSPIDPSFLELLKEITDRDRLILREMSLQLLDRHREQLSQRELRQRMPSRKET